MLEDNNEKSLGGRVASSKPFSKSFNDPIWDWTTQRWKGCIIGTNATCSYYDFSMLRPVLIHELRIPILQGLKGDLSGLKQVITDIDRNLNLKIGDLIQIGKTKNRGLFIVSTNRLLPITQTLGGNGFGEIPLNFIDDITVNNSSFVYSCDYWTYMDHPIISHVPYLKKENDDLETQNIRIGKQLFSISEGSDSLKHPYIYLDFDTNEYFTLPLGIKERFNNEIERLAKTFLTGEYKNLLEESNPVRLEIDPMDLITVEPKKKAKKKATTSKIGTSGRKGGPMWLRNVKNQKKDQHIVEDEVPKATTAITAAKISFPRIESTPKPILGQIMTQSTNGTPLGPAKIVVNIKPRSDIVNAQG